VTREITAPFWIILALVALATLSTFLGRRRSLPFGLFFPHLIKQSKTFSNNCSNEEF
jgi:hypothetical protein